LIGIHELEDAGFFPKDDHPKTEAFKGDEVEGKDALGNTIVDDPVDTGKRDERHVTHLTEFNWLMRREGNAMKRDKMFLVARFVQATAMSLLVGIIFLNVGEADPTVPSVSAWLYFAIFLIRNLIFCGKPVCLSISLLACLVALHLCNTECE
jgi:hypothetical protein